MKPNKTAGGHEHSSSPLRSPRVSGGPIFCVRKSPPLVSSHSTRTVEVNRGGGFLGEGRDLRPSTAATLTREVFVGEVE